MIVNRRKFEDELALLSLTTNEKSAIPALRHVLLEASGDVLSLSSTDIESSLFGSVKLGAPTEPFVGFPPVKRLLSTVRSLSGEEVELKMTTSGRLALKSGGHRSEIPCLSRHDFPLCRPEEPEAWVEIPSGSLLALIRDGGFCSDSEKPPFGFAVTLAEKKLSVCSTDHSNAVLSALISDEAEESASMSAIIADHAMPAVESLCSKSEKVAIGLGATQVRIRDDAGRVLVCRKIDSPMPNIRALLERGLNFKVGLSFDRAEMSSVLKRVSSFIEATPRDEIDIEIGSEMILRGGDVDNGRVIETVESAKDFAGTDRFIVKYSRFVEAIRHVRSERVILRRSSEDKGSPIVLFNHDPNGVFGEWGFFSGTIHHQPAASKTP